MTHVWAGVCEDPSSHLVSTPLTIKRKCTQFNKLPNTLPLNLNTYKATKTKCFMCMLLTCYIDKFLTRIHNYTHPLHYIYIYIAFLYGIHNWITAIVLFFQYNIALVLHEFCEFHWGDSFPTPAFSIEAMLLCGCIGANQTLACLRLVPLLT